MPKKTALVALCMFALGCTDNGAEKVGTKVANSGKEPLTVVQLTNSDGSERTANICIMPGREIILGPSGWPVWGEGYLEALPERTFYIGFSEADSSGRRFGGIRIKRIFWDDKGKTTTVEGLQPVIEAASEIRIVSNLEEPVIKQGALILEVEKGKQVHEYRFEILFGRGQKISPAGLL